MENYNNEDFDHGAINRIINKYIAPKIEKIFNEILNSGIDPTTTEFAHIFYDTLLTDELKDALEEEGLDLKDCINIEINAFHINNEDYDEFANIDSNEDVQKKIEEELDKKDKYKIVGINEGIFSINAYELKSPLSIDDVDPVSDDDLKRMLGNE
jgi:hypothetical protein